MKSVLLSTRPKWCEKICHGEKTIEVRKSAPKEVPFKAYIYCTKDRKNLLPIEHGKVLQKVNFWENTDAYYGFGKVIGEFICNELEKFSVGSLRCDDIEKLACLSYREMINYFYKPEELDGKTSKMGYAWHISQLKIYDKPKELSEFRKPLDRVWGSYCNDYCDRGCISFGSTDYSCNDYWDWEKGLTCPPQSWMYVEELEE